MRFIAGGRERALKALEPQLKAVYLEIERDVASEYAIRLETAHGLIQRMLVRRHMKRELEKRFAEAVRSIRGKAPPHGIY